MRHNQKDYLYSILFLRPFLKKGGEPMNHNEQMAALYVGIDVSARSNYYHAMDFFGKKHLSFQSLNNHPGTEDAVIRIIEALAASGLSHLVIVMESTGFYSWHVANTFASHERLIRYKPAVYCLNPKVIANYKKSFVDMDKTDPLDAMVIADYARIGRIDAAPWRGGEYMPLQRLTRQRLHIVSNLSREKNYLLTNIFLKFSELAVMDQKDRPFSDIFGATSTAVLTEFLSSEEIAETSIDELVRFIVKSSRNRFADPDATAAILQKAARDSYRLNKALADPLNVAIAMSFDQIKFLEKQLKQIDKVIERTVRGLNDNHYICLNSVKGIGLVFASGIIAEIGDIRKFDNQAALAKYAGLTWRKTQSGKFSAQNTFLTKTGNRYLRYYLIEAVTKLIRFNPEYRQYYLKKYHEVTKFQHKRALALTARKFVRLVFALLSKNQLFSADLAACSLIAE